MNSRYRLPSLAVLAMSTIVAWPAIGFAIDCQFESIVSVNFAAYDVFSASNDDSTGTITWSCTGSGSTTLRLDLTAGYYGTYATRKLGADTERLNYNLYTNSARTTIWGNGTSGTSRYSQVVNNSNGFKNRDVVVTVYGRIPPGQDVPEGTYYDAMTITMTY